MSDEALDLFLGVTIERVLVRLVEAEKGGVTGPGCGAGLLLWREIYRALTESRDAIAAAVARLALLESVLAEAREAELTFTHEQISERDQVIADEAWNAALEAAISEAKRMRFGWLNRAQALHKAGQSSTVPSISEDTAAQIIDVMLALRRGAS